MNLYSLFMFLVLHLSSACFLWVPTPISQVTACLHNNCVLSFILLILKKLTTDLVFVLICWVWVPGALSFSPERCLSSLSWISVLGLCYFYLLFLWPEGFRTRGGVVGDCGTQLERSRESAGGRSATLLKYLYVLASPPSSQPREYPTLRSFSSFAQFSVVPWTSASFPASGKIQHWCVKVPWCFIGMMRTSSLPGRTFVKILSVPRRRVKDCNIPPVSRNFGVFALSSLFTSDTVTLYFFLWLQQVSFFFGAFFSLHGLGFGFFGVLCHFYP